MAGKLDEISEAIGGLRVRVENLAQGINHNRELADKRHKENTDRLSAIEQTLAGLVSDRRLVVVMISTAVGGIMWLASYLLPWLFRKWQ